MLSGVKSLEILSETGLTRRLVLLALLYIDITIEHHFLLNSTN